MLPASPRLPIAAFACLAATASALTPASVLRSSLAPALRAPAAWRAPEASRAPRSSRLVAQYDQRENLPAGWSSRFDQASQAIYYVNEATGVSQWEPPQAAAYWESSTAPQAAAAPQAARMVWRLVPTTGVCNVVFNVANGQQQVLGRSHLADAHPGDPTYPQAG